MKKSIIFVTGSFRAGGFERRLKQLTEWLHFNEEEIDFNVLYQSKKGKNIPDIAKQKLHWWPSHYFVRLNLSILENFLFFIYLKWVSGNKVVTIFVGHQSILNHLTSNKWINNNNNIHIVFNLVNNLNYSPYKLETLNSLKYCKKIVTNSIRNKDEINNYDNNIEVYYVPNYYEREVNKLVDGRFDKEQINLVACGSFHQQKNFLTLIQTIGIINKSVNNIHLTIFGDGIQKNQLIELSDSIGIKNYTMISGEDFKQHVHNYDLFIMSSIFEGYPNALLEAQISGLPSVAFNVDFGPNEIIINNYSGQLVDLLEPKDLATAIILVLKNLETYKENTKRHSASLIDKHATYNSILKLLELLD